MQTFHCVCLATKVFEIKLNYRDIFTKDAQGEPCRNQVDCTLIYFYDFFIFHSILKLRTICGNENLVANFNSQNMTQWEI